MPAHRPGPRKAGLGVSVGRELLEREIKGKKSHQGKLVAVG
jgi:hypothetical protein